MAREARSPGSSGSPRSPKYAEWLQEAQRYKEMQFAARVLVEEGEPEPRRQVELLERVKAAPGPQFYRHLSRGKSLKNRHDRAFSGDTSSASSAAESAGPASEGEEDPPEMPAPSAHLAEAGENMKQKVAGIEKWMETQSLQTQALQSLLCMQLRDLPTLTVTSNTNADRLDAILAAVTEMQRSIATIESSQRSLQDRLQQVEEALHSGSDGCTMGPTATVESTVGPTAAAIAAAPTAAATAAVPTAATRAAATGMDAERAVYPPMEKAPISPALGNSGGRTYKV